MYSKVEVQIKSNNGLIIKQYQNCDIDYDGGYLFITESETKTTYIHELSEIKAYKTFITNI